MDSPRGVSTNGSFVIVVIVCLLGVFGVIGPLSGLRIGR